MGFEELFLGLSDGEYVLLLGEFDLVCVGRLAGMELLLGFSSGFPEGRAEGRVILFLELF